LADDKGREILSNMWLHGSLAGELRQKTGEISKFSKNKGNNTPV